MKLRGVLHKLADWTCDAALIALSLVGAFLLRFDFAIPVVLIPILKKALLFALIVKLPILDFAGFHRRPRRYAGLADLVRLCLANLAASTVFTVVIFLDVGRMFPRSIYLLDAVLCCCFLGFAHFSVRLYTEAIARENRTRRRKRVLVYGAGSAGVTLVREILSFGQGNYEVAGFLDDDPHKRNAIIVGVPVLGRGRDAAPIVKRFERQNTPIDEIVIAMPSARGPQLREAIAKCRTARVLCRTVPGIDEVLDGKVLFAQIRDVSFADLLGREAVQLDESPIRSSITNRSLLITGAAGSIGSELCRQVSRFDPGHLVMFDQAESDLFKIDSELRQNFPKLRIHSIVGDIRDPERIEHVMKTFAVESIFHAAAYKHVPMMEDQPLEAVQNNVLGTWNLLGAVRRYGVSNFLMISTDKAVRPSSVMGVTKRICELLVADRIAASNSRTKCVAVRFGNVLGSNGSVIPVFQSQIAAGGPVRVTHPEMRRYFMTTSEAAALVLQASTMGKGSEIFVLDMGEPVRILDLAINLIRLSGREPFKEIDIQFTGPRPGEKLYEEINTASERLRPTFHPKIKIFEDSPARLMELSSWMTTLKRFVASGLENEVIAHIKELVPEYEPSALWQQHDSRRSRKRRLLREQQVSGFEQLARVHQR